MIVRIVFAAALTVALLALHSSPLRYAAAEDVTVAAAAPQPSPDQEIVAKIIARLQSDELARKLQANEEAAWVEAQQLILRLGSFPHRPEAIRELLRLVEFGPIARFSIPFYFDIRNESPRELAERATRMEALGASFQDRLPDPVRDYPAVKVLIFMGPVIAQYLVDDYVQRFVAASAVDPTFFPRRLGKLLIIATNDDRIAAATVVYALRRLADEKNPIAQNAYRSLIQDILGQYHYQKRKQLFPAEAFDV